MQLLLSYSSWTATLTSSWRPGYTWELIFPSMMRSCPSPEAAKQPCSTLIHLQSAARFPSSVDTTFVSRGVNLHPWILQTFASFSDVQYYRVLAFWSHLGWTLASMKKSSHRTCSSLWTHQSPDSWRSFSSPFINNCWSQVLWDLFSCHVSANPCCEVSLTHNPNCFQPTLRK